MYYRLEFNRCAPLEPASSHNESTCLVDDKKLEIIYNCSVWLS